MTKKTKLYKLSKNRIKTCLKISKTQNWPPKSKKKCQCYKKIIINKITKKTKHYKLPQNRIKNIFENFKNSKLTQKKHPIEEKKNKENQMIKKN